VLADAQLSRQHAFLKPLADGRAFLEDLGSMNGTYVDGVRIREPKLLEGNEHVRMGEAVFATSVEEPSGAPTVARPVVPSAPGPATRERAVLRRGLRRATILAGIATVVAIALVVVIVLRPWDGPGGATVSEMVADVKPSTVSVTALADGRPSGGGTGWVLDAGEGLIVTNHHVVNAGNGFVIATEAGATPAEIVGTAPCEDLTVLRVADPSGLETLQLGSQSELEQGDTVVALGFPVTASTTENLIVTEGVVSAVETTFELDAPDVPHYDNVVQTDAPINPGNSGGPLVDLDGNLVGVNTAINRVFGGQIIEGQGYAIGVDRVKEVTPTLRQGTSLAWTGMSLQSANEELLAQAGLPQRDGFVVVGTVAGTPAAQAGFDGPVLVTAVDGQPMDGVMATYCAAVEDKSSGDSAVFTVIPSGETQEEQVEVAFA